MKYCSHNGEGFMQPILKGLGNCKKANPSKEENMRTNVVVIF